LAVAFPSVSTLAGSIDRIQRDADLDDQWLKARGLVTTRFGGSNTPADFIAAAPLLGELARAEDRAGRLVVAWPFSLTPSDSLEIQRTTDLVVNPQYLERQHVVDEEGLRIRGPLPSDTVLLLIPASQKTQKEQIESRAVQWLELQREVQKSSKAMPVVKSVIVKSGQELFTYHAASRASDSTQIDPIVLVASPDSTALSDDFLVSAASSGGLLFSGGGKLSSLTVSTGLDKYLTSIDSVSDLALEERARRLAEVQMKAGELTLIVAVLIALTLVLSAAYCERQRRRLFLERVHGRSFIRRHLVFLGAVAGGALAVLGACVLLRAAESILGLAACAVLIAVLLPTAVIALARNDRVVTSRVPE
jgi:hypothetical protein